MTLRKRKQNHRPASRQQVRELWQDRAGDAGVPDREVTHPDVWQRWLDLEGPGAGGAGGACAANEEKGAVQG